MQDTAAARGGELAAGAEHRPPCIPLHEVAAPQRQDEDEWQQRRGARAHEDREQHGCRPERQDPPEELVRVAMDWDCRFAIDTDAHATGQLEWQNYGCDKLARLGVEADQVVNTMAADALVAWAAAH